MRFQARGILLLIILSGIVSSAHSQRSEIGFGLGTFNYTGDLARTYDFRNSKPAATLIYRSNLSKIISFRTSFTAGKLGATDRRQPFTTHPSFNIFILEASGAFEYHFLNWRDDKQIRRFTPYMFAGLGIFAMSGVADKGKAEYSNVQSCIPFGLGMKYVLNPKWYVSLEFGMRKTFFDYLDNLSSIDNRKKSYNYGNAFDNDAYYFLGVTLTRTFYTIPCPTSPYK
jgi:hypothetical protein